MMHPPSARLSQGICRQCRALLASEKRLHASFPPLSRYIQIQATASSTPPMSPLPDNEPPIQSLSPPPPRQQQPISPLSPGPVAPTPDARFEILAGAHPSVLSIALSASQPLHTRRGTLIGASGPIDSAVSSLSVLSPFVRAAVGVPFLYQRIVSTAPINLLIGSKDGDSGFVVVHLDGRVDWRVVQRAGLVAWSGRSLGVNVGVDVGMSLAHWGHSTVTGRGLMALAGRGQVFEIRIGSGEEYLVHPSNVLAYTTNPNPPQPFRFKSASGRLQIPSLGSVLPDVQFFRVMRETATFRALANVFFTLRTWTRKTIWGDRLFLRFHGPSTLLLQSQGSSLRNSLTSREVNEIADAPAGAVPAALKLNLQKRDERDNVQQQPTPQVLQPSSPQSMTYANVGKDGKVSFS